MPSCLLIAVHHCTPPRARAIPASRHNENNETRHAAPSGRARRTILAACRHASTAVDLERELLTAEDFLEWLEPGRTADLIAGKVSRHSPVSVRLIAGKVSRHSPVSVRHADLLNFLDGILRLYVDWRRLGFLYREVVTVRLGATNVFQPDLAFYRAERRGIIRANHIEGAPDLVVEVLSPRTADRDTGAKFTAYEQHGVIEYWILDPETLVHRFYRRAGGLLMEYATEGPRIESQVVPGFFVMREWLDPERTRPITESLAQIEG